MGSHSTHAMHENSFASWRLLNHSKYTWRICNAFDRCGAMTDREVMDEAGIKDKNDVSPVITRMKDAGAVIECGKIRCTTTGRLVRLSRMAGGRR